MKKKIITITILILSPLGIFADGNISICDNENLSATLNHSSYIGCGNPQTTLGENASLYGITFKLENLPSGDGSFKIYDYNGSQSECQTYNFSGVSTGLNTFVFESPVAFDSIDIPAIKLYNDNACVSSVSNWYKYTSTVHNTHKIFYWDNSFFDNTTRIVDFNPQDKATTTSPVDFDIELYINENDIASTTVTISLHNIDQNWLLPSFLSDYDIYILDNVTATTSGVWTHATSTALADGNYRLKATLKIQDNWFFDLFDRTIEKQIVSHQFIVGTSTFIGSMSQNMYELMNEEYANLSATSTAGMMSSCNPIFGFNIGQCLAYLMIPDGELLNDSIDNFKEKVTTHFPLGYITDFLQIMSTTTTSNMPILNATLPSALGIGTPSIELDLTGVLDFILEADGGDFTENNDKTFYETTNEYWKKILFLLAFLYIIGRIIGRQFNPF